MMIMMFFFFNDDDDDDDDALYDIEGILHAVNHYIYGNKNVYSWDTCIVFI